MCVTDEKVDKGLCGALFILRPLWRSSGARADLPEPRSISQIVTDVHVVHTVLKIYSPLTIRYSVRIVGDRPPGRVPALRKRWEFPGLYLAPDYTRQTRLHRSSTDTHHLGHGLLSRETRSLGNSLISRRNARASFDKLRGASLNCFCVTSHPLIITPCTLLVCPEA